MFKKINLLTLLIFFALWETIVGGAIFTYFFFDYYFQNYTSWSEFFWACFTIEHYVNYWKYLFSSKINIILIFVATAPLLIAVIYLAWDWVQENYNKKAYYGLVTEPPSESVGEQTARPKSKRRRKKKKKKQNITLGRPPVVKS